MTHSLLSYLPFEATNEQAAALSSIDRFITGPDNYLIIRGSAGTGKTSIMSAVTRYLIERSIIPVPLAPTGRAAKNLGRKMGLPAKTLHACLYVPETDVEEAVVRFIPRANDCLTQQVFIADESSMVSDRLENSSDYIASRSLLTEFIDFVRQGNANNKIIFVGDVCQLPPVGYDPKESSPALVAEYLERKFRITGSTIELTQVVRQREDSYILRAANQLRNIIYNPGLKVPSQLGNKYYKAEDAVKLYLERFIQNQPDRVAILSLGNEYRNTCIDQIRAALGLQGKLVANDTVVLSQAYLGYRNLANGEIGIVRATNTKLSRVAGMEFMEAEVIFRDEIDSEFSVSAMVNLSALQGPISHEQRKALFAAEMRNNPSFRKSLDIRDSQFLNSIQLNYGHAFTVHKAQGSEWDSIIMNTWMHELDPRFLYTGITRARSELFTNGAHKYVA